MTVTLASDVAGWLGAGCLLAAYGLLSAGRLSAGRGYHLLNLAGSAGLAVSALVHSAWPSAALNLVWLFICVAALHGLARQVAGRATAPVATRPHTSAQVSVPARPQD